MTRARAIVVPTLAVSLALAAAGCGSSGSSSSSSSSSSGSAGAPASASSSSSAPKASSGGAQIKMSGFQFAPKETTVKVGETVTWTNDDSAAHNVTAETGATFKSADFGQGKTFTFKPTKAGTITYVCTLHPGMTGTLKVTS